MDRITGQCNTADIISIEHLASTLTGDGPEQLDVDTLSKKQKYALVLVAAFREAGIKYDRLYQVKEVLFWESGLIEWRFHDTPKAVQLRMELSNQTVKDALVRGIRNLLNVPMRR